MPGEPARVARFPTGLLPNAGQTGSLMSIVCNRQCTHRQSPISSAISLFTGNVSDLRICLPSLFISWDSALSSVRPKPKSFFLTRRFLFHREITPEHRIVWPEESGLPAEQTWAGFFLNGRPMCRAESLDLLRDLMDEHS